MTDVKEALSAMIWGLEPWRNDVAIIHTSVAHIRAQEAEIECLRKLVSQLRGYSAAPRYWEERWRDEKAENGRLKAVLKQYAETYCEGWCSVNGGSFEDCGGCPARAALEGKNDDK